MILLFLVVSSLHFIGDFISFSPSSNISQLFLPHLLTVGLTAVPVFLMFLSFFSYPANVDFAIISFGKEFLESHIHGEKFFWLFIVMGNTLYFRYAFAKWALPLFRFHIHRVL